MATETQAEIDRINTEVSTQASKIAQLSSILDGKAAGGGSGGAVETCTVTCTPDIILEPDIEPLIVYMSTDGVILTDTFYTGTLTVVKNSVLCVMNAIDKSTVSGNIEIMYYYRGCTAMSVTGDATIKY